MENFSTPPRALLPWVANLATLAVVVLAIGWSNEQRPDASATAASAQAPVAAPLAPVADSVPASPAAAQGRRPAPTTAAPMDGLQTVGFVPGKLR